MTNSLEGLEERIEYNFYNSLNFSSFFFFVFLVQNFGNQRMLKPDKKDIIISYTVVHKSYTFIQKDNFLLKLIARKFYCRVSVSYANTTKSCSIITLNVTNRYLIIRFI